MSDSTKATITSIIAGSRGGRIVFTPTATDVKCPNGGVPVDGAMLQVALAAGTNQVTIDYAAGRGCCCSTTVCIDYITKITLTPS